MALYPLAHGEVDEAGYDAAYARREKLHDAEIDRHDGLRLRRQERRRDPLDYQQILHDELDPMYPDYTLYIQADIDITD